MVFRVELIAPCGMDCALCLGHLREVVNRIVSTNLLTKTPAKSGEKGFEPPGPHLNMSGTPVPRGPAHVHQPR